MSDIERIKLKEELSKKIHEQFAENQKAKEQSLIKILGLIGGVIAVYFYVYEGYLTNKFDAFQLRFALTSSIVLFSGAAWIVVANAYYYRRDQYLHNKVRFQFGLFENLLPANYNPISIYLLKKRKNLLNLFMDKKVKCFLDMVGLYGSKFYFSYIRWLPDSYMIYFFLFPFFMILIMIIGISDLEFTLNLKKIDAITTLVILFNWVMILITLFVLPIKYSNKLIRRLLVWHGIIPFGILYLEKEEFINEMKGLIGINTSNQRKYEKNIFSDFKFFYKNRKSLNQDHITKIESIKTNYYFFKKTTK